MRPPLRILLVLWGILFSSIETNALTVNRLNGGANVIYVDFSIPGSVLPMELVRAYNSITATNEQTGWLGAFGWGWTSPFETTLTTTPERHVVLRDGGTGNTVRFKPRVEDPKVRELFYAEIKRAYFERQKNTKLTDSDLSRLQIPDRILSRLKIDPLYRFEMAEKYGVKSVVPQGEALISSEFGYQTIQFKNNRWIREKDGISQIFDKEGRLIRQIDKNGFYFEFKYSKQNKGQLVEITDQDRTMSLKFTWRADKVIEIIDNRSQRSRYSYDNSGNLTQVIDSTGSTFAYRYESKRYPHLLTKIEYPDESSPKERLYRELKYDDSGLVVYHREKDGIETTYLYGKSPSDPENNFWTKSVRKNAAQSEEQYDEFLIQARPDGSKFLYKQITRMNGVETTTLYTPCCGKPQQISKNGEITNFKYSDSGLLIEKVSPKEDVRLEYDPRWKKVSKVTQNGLVSQYEYDGNGNLVRATNSKGEKVKLKYDKGGRITEMVDTEAKVISFKYNEVGKPIWISEKGVGTIRIEYAPDGRIAKTETLIGEPKDGRKPSQAKSQEVVRRVMKGFQNLLDIIRPAGVTLMTAG